MPKRGLPETLRMRHDAHYVETLAASAGATDFGAYFSYFSFFLVVSAVLLAALGLGASAWASRPRAAE